MTPSDVIMSMERLRDQIQAQRKAFNAAAGALIDDAAPSQPEPPQAAADEGSPARAATP